MKERRVAIDGENILEIADSKTSHAIAFTDVISGRSEIVRPAEGNLLTELNGEERPLNELGVPEDVAKRARGTKKAGPRNQITCRDVAEFNADGDKEVAGSNPVKRNIEIASLECARANMGDGEGACSDKKQLYVVTPTITKTTG